MIQFAEEMIDNNTVYKIVGNNGSLYCVVDDKSNFLNRKEYFNQKSEYNPVYLASEKKKRKLVAKEPVFDSTATIPALNYKHDSKKFKEEFNAMVAADERCYEQLKKGNITYAKNEIAELQFIADSFTDEKDKIDFMHWIQITKRHSVYLTRVRAESENRDRMRCLGYNSMRYYPLSYLSITYSIYLYTKGASAECLESYLSLKNGNLNKYTKTIEQEVKREICIPFEHNLAFMDMERFRQLPLDTGRNLEDAKHQEIADEYLKLGSIKAVVDKLGYSETTVRKWVYRLVLHKDAYDANNLVA